MTDIAESVAQATLPSSTADASEEVTAPSAPKKVILLLEYLMDDVPVKLRLAAYTAIVQAVKGAELPGLIHPVDKGELVVVNTKGQEVTRQYAHVLLANSPELSTQLDDLLIVAVNSELVRSRGRAMSVTEMLAMGDALDFDALTTKAKSSAGQKQQPKPKAKQTRPANRK
ncbi:hypothetical protein [Deinococcus ruber]|uniref:Uncharacterized protein n=1 Tax=Deinococcus ruber TaxID=1848197 RepID=A0A918FIW9_9DEIO|nr:hypothetical protein [Deinococcus ruber]GGR40357.1 hypothetical protein GCM10008957_56070 [Deinococcus ruber]